MSEPSCASVIAWHLPLCDLGVSDAAPGHSGRGW